MCRITIMRGITLVLTLTCFVMHFILAKCEYEYQFDPLFNLTFVGCTVVLLALLIIKRFGLIYTADPEDTVIPESLVRVETIFDLFAFALYIACGFIMVVYGCINVVYDDRPATLIKGWLSIMNGICFFLNAVIYNQCHYRWGNEMPTENMQRLNERLVFPHFPHSMRVRYM